MDRTDRELLAALQKDGRTSNKELAALVGLAPSSCHTRVQRLVDEGVLRGFTAHVDPEALGVGLQAMVAVQLTGNPKKRLERFLEFAMQRDEVLEAYQIAGKNDLLLHVAVRDVEHMRALVMDTLSSRPEVAHLESSLVYRHHRGSGWPDLLDS